MRVIEIPKSNADEKKQAQRQFELDVLKGLSHTPKSLPSKYFYDDRGSELFIEIMAQPEYYLTNAEAEILTSRAGDIVSEMGKATKFDIIELGAGDGTKTKAILDAASAQDTLRRYVAIDISQGALEGLDLLMKDELPQVDFLGLRTDYFKALEWLDTEEHTCPRLVLFLGSNIGNFNHAGAIVFLKTLWRSLKDGDCVLVGFDKKKDIDRLLHAYNDSAGKTADFNINLLTRINRELGGDFNTKEFKHFGTYNPNLGAMESFLISQKEQSVTLKALSKTFHFGEFEPVHLEFSTKYTEKEIAHIAHEAGFRLEESFEDRAHDFIDALLRVDKNMH